MYRFSKTENLIFEEEGILYFTTSKELTDDIISEIRKGKFTLGELRKIKQYVDDCKVPFWKNFMTLNNQSQNNYIVILMTESGPEMFQEFISLEEADACCKGIEMVDILRIYYSRIWNIKNDELEDQKAIEDGYSQKTLKDLEKIRKFYKIKRINMW